jgi:hypothetical protein
MPQPNIKQNDNEQEQLSIASPSASTIFLTMGSLSTRVSLQVSPRINQLDASMLDNEVSQHLSEQLKSALAFIPSRHFNFSPQTLAAAADILFFLATTGRQLPTPGQAMLYAAIFASLSISSPNFTLCT